MKCFYYLTPTVESTRKITDDLYQSGIDCWFIHILSKGDNGFRKDHTYSSNYLEQLDILRFGIIGAIIGLVVGLIAVSLVNSNNLFGANIPNIVYYAITVFFTLFGAWEGGLIGINSENKKTAIFNDDLQSGKYLILIYVKNAFENTVKDTMQTQHPETKLVAVDASFYNPLASLERL